MTEEKGLATHSSPCFLLNPFSTGAARRVASSERKVGGAPCRVERVNAQNPWLGKATARQGQGTSQLRLTPFDTARTGGQTLEMADAHRERVHARASSVGTRDASSTDRETLESKLNGPVRRHCSPNMKLMTDSPPNSTARPIETPQYRSQQLRPESRHGPNPARLLTDSTSGKWIGPVWSTFELPFPVVHILTRNQLSARCSLQKVVKDLRAEATAAATATAPTATQTPSQRNAS